MMIKENMLYRHLLAISTEILELVIPMKRGRFWIIKCQKLCEYRLSLPVLYQQTFQSGFRSRK